MLRSKAAHQSCPQTGRLENVDFHSQSAERLGLLWSVHEFVRYRWGATWCSSLGTAGEPLGAALERGAGEWEKQQERDGKGDAMRALRTQANTNMCNTQTINPCRAGVQKSPLHFGPRGGRASCPLGQAVDPRASQTKSGLSQGS